jgi:hypothetical protein
MIFVTGCKQSGDFDAFVVTQVVKYGGHTKTSSAIPKLQARWTVKEDKNGFTASISGASFADIAREMEQIFGPPRMSDDGSGTKTHEPYRLWGVDDIGVAIQLIGHPDSTEIVCIREIKSMDELIKHMPKK